MRVSTTRLALSAALSTLALAAGGAAQAQDRLEQANPERVEENRPAEPIAPATTPPPTTTPAIEPVPAPLDDVTVRLSAIDLIGLKEVDPNSLRPVLSGFIDRPLRQDELKDIVNALVVELHRRGYVFATASVPAQSVDNGRLTVSIDEGFVDGVVIEGEDQAYARSVLERLADGRPVTQARLERQILIANDNAGTYVGRSSYGTVDGRGVLTVRVSHDRLSGVASLDNWGSRFVGPVRARAAVRFAGVFDSADALALSLSTVPASPREYRYGRLGYVRRLGTSGTEASIGVSAGETRLGSTLRERGIAGSSRSASVGLSHPLVRSRDASLWGDLGFTVRSSSQDRLRLAERDDRFTELSADLYGSLAVGDARLRGRLTATRGLGLFDATRGGDPLASRSDGDARYTTVFAALSLAVPVVARLAVQIAGEGQLASRPLLSSVEFGVGGSDIGRGYDYSERLGDEGVAGIAALVYALPNPTTWTDELRLSAFVDGGVARDLGIRRFDGSIASAGIGAAVDLDERISGELTIAVPLTGPRDASGDRSPRIGFTVAKRF